MLGQGLPTSISLRQMRNETHSKNGVLHVLQMLVPNGNTGDTLDPLDEAGTATPEPGTPPRRYIASAQLRRVQTARCLSKDAGVDDGQTQLYCHFKNRACGLGQSA